MIKVDENIVLKKVTIDDAQDMFEYASNKNLTKFLPWDAHKDIEETKFVINNFFKYDENNPNFGVFYNNKLIGTCGCSQPLDNKDLELGYALSVDYHNKGIITKSCKAFFKWAKQQGFENIRARVLDDNHSSVAVMKKLGFEKTDEIVDRDGIAGPIYVLRLS